jgi:hypothetical protein
LPYIFNLVLVEGVHFFKLEREAYLHNIKNTQSAREILKQITHNPLEYLLSYGNSKAHKRIRLPSHNLPLRGRKKLKRKTLVKLSNNYFEPEYTTAPFLPL